MKQALRNFFLNDKIPSNLKLFVNQVVYWAIAVTLADIFVYNYEQGSIDADTLVPWGLSFIADRIFNVHKVYMYTVLIIVCVVLYHISKKYKLSLDGTQLLKGAGIAFNKLLAFFSLMMGLAVFLHISSYDVGFISSVNAVETLLAGLLLTHFVILAIHLENKS
ncbi:hypothetical protein [Vibrio owensii]|uniref:hypothetical protein n=1 Tax=Vibrio owensii TaxID=696485 RepID=UPI0018F2475A|nr:hypothetical protein [Vibrio owensii]